MSTTTLATVPARDRPEAVFRVDVQPEYCRAEAVCLLAPAAGLEGEMILDRGRRRRVQAGDRLALEYSPDASPVDMLRAVLGREWREVTAAAPYWTGRTMEAGA